MQTKQIIQQSANVIRIIKLSKGDIYKRYDTNSYSDKILFGVVQDVKNDGENTFIEAVEYKYSYSELEADIKVFSGDSDVSIFPATLDEIKEKFESCVRNTQRNIEGKQEEIAKLEKALDTTKKLVSGELTKELKTPEFKELPQNEYNAKKVELAQKNDVVI